MRPARLSIPGRSRPTAGPRLRRLLVVAIPLLLGVAVLASTVRAGRIHPAVQEALSGLSPTEPATVLLILERQSDIQALDRALKVQRATRRERHRRVIEALQAEARESQSSILSELSLRSDAGEVAGYTPYWISNLIVVRGTRAAIEDLARRADVAVVEPDFRAVLMEPMDSPPASVGDAGFRGIGVPPGLRAINAPRVWNELGVNGAGAIVANLDTGVDGDHPALHDRWRGNNGHPWQECWHDALGSGTEYPTDPVAHGTHVMGTITGLGAATQDSIGVAWGAEWIAANAINQGPGSEFDNDVIDCIQWLADPDGDPETVEDVPDVVQNSWGVSEAFGYADCDTRWWAVIDNCEAAGVVMTWSVGGDGPAPGSIRSPADRATTATNCFSIGAVDATNFDFPYPIASFSSRGPTGCDVPPLLKIKPEVVAPGVEIYSSVPGGGYQVYSGTSMAGPHVAGVVALMRSADPDLDVDTIKEVLMITARDGGPAGEDNAYGWGTIDAYEAVVRIAPAAVPPRDAAGASRLFTGRPNPFTRETTLRFWISTGGPATLAIHDASGRLVRTILSGPLPAGEHTACWDARDQAGLLVPAGMYFSALKAPGFAEQRKVLLLR